MDNTELYIKMCGKAMELQKTPAELILKDGDVLTYECLGKREIFVYSSHAFWLMDVMGDKGTYIWLPRQDELQEMVKKDTETHKALITRLLNAGYLTSVDWSMEQLWLAFVMKTLYSKVWNGEDWEVTHA